ncbi:hypothetical protein LJB42_001939 [Komagataella kurtzmanii]|nr:hypothetical protein LJB42_001939 [Komagataella kurtzmanii]
MIQGTNDYSIVSKRSVEMLYKPVLSGSEDKPTEYFKHVVKKPQRRSPAINRGYWLRMHSIKESLRSIMDQSTSETVIIINLGAGYDVLPFELLENEKTNIFCIDVDYPDLISKKISLIRGSSELRHIINEKSESAIPKHGIMLKTDNYAAVGCDLNDLPLFEQLMTELNLCRDDVCSIFIAEVSLAYMKPTCANPIIQETSKFPNSHFLLLEQLLPAGERHPFSRTMLYHFSRLDSPLQCVQTYPTIEEQCERITSLGFNNVEARDLFHFWKALSADIKSKIASVEAFDEWEEFVMYAQHYIVLHATNSNVQVYQDTEDEKEGTESTEFVETNLITIEGPELIQRKFAACQSFEGDIVLHGGLDITRSNTTVVIKGNCATEITHNDPLSKLMCQSLTNHNGKLHLSGGRSAPGKPTTECWSIGKLQEKLPDLLEPRSRHCAVSTENGLLLFGGCNGDAFSLLSDVNLPAAWKNISSSMPNLEAAAMCYHDGLGLIAGGMLKSGTINGTVYSFYVQGDTVISKPIFQHKLLARYGSKVVHLKGSEYIFIGGVSFHQLFNQENWLVKFNIDTKTVIPLKISDDDWNNFPMLVGFNATIDETSKITCIGGGAVCFAFGSVSNPQLLTIVHSST